MRKVKVLLGAATLAMIAAVWIDQTESVRPTRRLADPASSVSVGEGRGESLRPSSVPRIAHPPAPAGAGVTQTGSTPASPLDAEPSAAASRRPFISTAHYEPLDEFLDSQAPDLEWQGRVSSALRKRFADQKHVQVDDARCGGTVCRVELAVTTDPLATAAVLDQLHTIPEVTGELTVEIDLERTPPLAVAYFSKEQHLLPLNAAETAR